MIDILTTLAAAAPAASSGAFNGNFALGVAGAGAGIGLGLIGMAALVGLPVGGACAYLIYTLYRDKRKK